jgi:hypothetical protein
MAIKLLLRGRHRLAEELERRGWWFDASSGGWMNYHVRNDDGMLLPFGTVEEVCRYLDIKADEYAERDRLAVLQ